MERGHASGRTPCAPSIATTKMTNTYDVAVIGAGTMGSAAAYHLSRRGKHVVVFEQFGVVHEMGSHSGQTRIIRHAYHESPDYVPLVLRADDLWLELENQTGTKLLHRTGGLVLGPGKGFLVRDALLACSLYHLPSEQLGTEEIRERWPQFHIPDHWTGCYDPRAGFLVVDSCIRNHCEEAVRHGAVLVTGETVDRIDGTRIHTTRDTYHAERVVVCAGSWTSRILADLHLPIVVKRKTVAWLRPKTSETFSIGRFPIFLAEVEAGILYGFPIHNHEGVKIANHNSLGPETTPDRADRTFQAEDAMDLQAFVREYLPGVSEEVLDGKICMYALTPDEDFILDFHPSHPEILIAAGFSGHGFKFAPVIGEILADLCIDGKTRHGIERFRISRF